MQSCAKSTRNFGAQTIFPSSYQSSGAERLGLEQAQWQSCLSEIAASHLGPAPSARELTNFFRALHMQDLALARACALDIPAAWEELVATHSAVVLRAALRIAAPDEVRARELAHSLWTDLYCNAAKLASYTGRGALENWLKASLYQSNTNLYRSERRFTTLEESLCPVYTELAPRDLAQVEVETIIEQSLRVVLGELSAEDRFLLSAHFLDERNLAQISALLRVHESTVSRRISKLLKQLRRRMYHRLRAEGLTSDFELSIRADFDLRRELL
jgi:RNA polymerase sigma-70 factor (ECF subfamily)